jgi:hypothetical protein
MFLAAFLCLFPVSSRAGNNPDALGQEEIKEAERLLSELGYWTGPIDGLPDEATQHATLAFQRVANLPATGLLKSVELSALRRASPIRPRLNGPFHLEVDVSRQIIFMVEPDGRITHALPIATGSGKWFKEGGRRRRATTPLGTFTVRRKIEGWRQSPLGLMYYPSYIQGGVAIHGSRKLPRHPATFGCIAVPLFAAETMSEHMPVGTVVIVYKNSKQDRSQFRPTSFLSL